MTAFAEVWLTCDQLGGCEAEYRSGTSDMRATRRDAQERGQWQLFKTPTGDYDFCPEHARPR